MGFGFRYLFFCLVVFDGKIKKNIFLIIKSIYTLMNARSAESIELVPHMIIWFFLSINIEPAAAALDVPLLL